MTTTGLVLVSRKTKPIPIAQQIAESLVSFAESGCDGALVSGVSIHELPKFEQAIQELGLDDVEVCKVDGRIFLVRKLSK